MDQRTIYRALKDVIATEDRFVVIHSALYALRVPEPGLKWPLLGALRQLVSEGHTLALPTFSFAFCRDGDFHHQTTASESGILGDWILTLLDVRRSRHPIYSLAVAGPRAADILACESTTTFGPDSPFGLFERENARLVMLGCSWNACTQFHFYEEEAQVPYRYYMEFKGTADFGAGPREARARMFVRDLAIDPVNEFGPAVRDLHENRQTLSSSLGEGTIESVDCAALGRSCRKLLDEDPYAFVQTPAVVRYDVEAKRRRAEQEPLRVAVLGRANLDLLATALRGTLSTLIPDRKIEVYTPPFGQAVQALLDPASVLNAFRPQLIIFPDRLEDLTGLDRLDETDGQDFEPVTDHLAFIQACGERFGATLLVNRFAVLQSPVLGAADRNSNDGVHCMVSEANRRLDDAQRDNPAMHLLDLAEAAQRFDMGPVTDPRLWYLGRLPFSQPFTRELARRFASMILTALGRSVRLLVLDLDNTLWGGVLGEDGIAGLQLGGDYPGNAYLGFQKALKQLSARGIALAIASKNDEAEARRAMASLPDMVLHEDDLAALRINWRDKPQNLVEIAEEVGLGLESIAFIDDNPAERARMRLMLPAVKVIDLPDDPARYTEALLTSPYLECLSLTEEDRKRAKRYAARRTLNHERQRFARIEDFYSHLDAKVHIAPLAPENAARAEQLARKTNQFNTTTRRYGRSELEALARDGTGVYVLGLEDRYSERENIGLLVVSWDRPRPRAAEVDLFLLSCRVLGRGVESAALGWLAGEAKRRGIRDLHGLIIESPRNEPARGIYQSHGFTAGAADGEWILDIGQCKLEVPAWVTVIDGVREPARAA